MNIFSAWLRGRAIVQYRDILRRLLSNDYGGSEFYLPAQVIASLNRHRLNKTHSLYAVAMFCTEESYAEYQSDISSDIDYLEARSIIGHVIFDGVSNFKQTDLSTSSPVAAGPNDSVGGISSSGGDGGGGGGE